MAKKAKASKAKSSKNAKEKRGFLGLPITIIVLILILLVSGVGGVLILRNRNDGSKRGSSDSAQEQIQEYFNSDKKSGSFLYESQAKDTKEDGSFWVDGRKFKIEFTEANDTKRWIISPDGELAYFCYEDEEVCKPSVAPVDNYMLRWEQPSDNAVDIGRDEEEDCQQLRYFVDETFDMKGASNPFYVEDIVYCMNEGEIIYREHKGNAIKEDGQKSTQSISRFYIQEVKYEVDGDESFFELPYDVEE